MEDLILPPLVPQSFRACTRCHSRKVKCDGVAPICTPCLRHSSECNIVENIFYSYETVTTLQKQILALEEQLKSQQSLSSAETSRGILEDISDPSRGTYDRNAHDASEPLAEEVGSLALGSIHNMSHRYVGSAAGASFTRIFFKHLELSGVQFSPVGIGSTSSTGFDPLASRASLPSKHISQLLLSYYITRVHIWWPIFHLPSVRGWFQQIYTSPSNCDSFCRYAVFMVLALGAYEAVGESAYQRLYDLFSPEEYFATAMTFYDQACLGVNLQSLQAILLLIIWLTRSSTSSDNGDLWQISRFAMSMAIELGCHRHNPKWGLGTIDKETRNRLWWSTYALERMVAVSTGRVLSMRNQAIDAHFPQTTSDDDLSEIESEISPTLLEKGFLPAIHLFRLRSIGGDILESVYIARPRAGNTLSVSETAVIADGLRQRLDRWFAAVQDCALPNSNELLKLHSEFYLLVLLLNRPSPSFPNPSVQAKDACANASRGAIETWTVLLERQALKKTWCTFHDILLSGLVWLYCVWDAPVFDESVVIHHSAQCTRLLQHVADTEKGNQKYIKLFEVVSQAVLKKCQQIQQVHEDPITTNLPGLFNTEWLGEYFDDVFMGDSAAFDMGFTTDEHLFAFPDS